MHRLLSPSQHIARARRRRGEIAVWRIRARRPIGGWSFDRAAIAVGQPWPDRSGVRRLVAERFEAPADWPLGETRLALDVGGESLLTIVYDDHSAQLGLDLHHAEFPMDAPAARLEIDAVAMGPFGTPVRDARLARAELIWIETGLDALIRRLGLAIDLAAELEGHELAEKLIELVEAAIARVRLPTRTVDVVGRESRYALGFNRDHDANPYAPTPLPDDARASIAEADGWLVGELRRLHAPPVGAVALMGHAHIDTAWLWPIEETRRKVRRTFSTAVDLLRRNPAFRFAQSFAEYYRQLEDDDPALLASIKQEVAAGRWEPVGGLWVEPDINMPSGESLVRQALYGQLYFERTFGQRHAAAWLPDTFGFSAALPQILMGAGLATLFTVKIGWSETNTFPHSRFWWEGIDGSRVLVQHMTHPEDNYNGQVTPRSLMRLWRNNADKEIAPEVILPIGFGDGGGGPTAEMIETQRALADFPLLPRSRFARVHDYYDQALAEAEAAGPAVPSWVGELYLEYHRGVLTSQGRTKRLHRQAEQALVGAELLASAAHILGGAAPASLEPLWRTLMINQFHDILPGSSITEVYARTEAELAGVVAQAREVAKGAMSALAARLGGDGEDALLIVNPDAAPRPVRLVSDQPIPGGQPAEEGFVLASRQTVPPLAAMIARPQPLRTVVATATSLENALLSIEFGPDGAITRIYDKRAGREVLEGRGNQIWAYHDQPRVYDAWDVEGDYRRSGQELTADSIEIAEAGGQRGALRITRRFGASTMVQSVRLWATSARIDFATRLDWHDRRVLLKARFPLAVRAAEATYECAFGVQHRPTHRNTSWDAAKFEVAGHRFADLSEPGYGVALINDGRYGYEALGGELSLSLLRAPIAPDRLADEGEQGFTYALLPHPGPWWQADVLAEAEDLNRPLYHHPAKGSAAAEPLAIIGGPRVALGALKGAEDGDGLILRIYEPLGARGQLQITPPPGWSVAGEVSLLEDAIDPPSPLIRPFEIRSWRLRRSPPRLRLAAENATVPAAARRPADQPVTQARRRVLTPA